MFFFLQYPSSAFSINFANFKLANVLDVRYPLDYVDYVFGLKTALKSVREINLCDGHIARVWNVLKNLSTLKTDPRCVISVDSTSDARLNINCLFERYTTV